MKQQERYEYQPKQRQYQQVENTQYEFYDQQQEQYEPSYTYPAEPQGPIIERNYETDNRYYQVKVLTKQRFIYGFKHFLILKGGC